MTIKNNEVKKPEVFICNNERIIFIIYKIKVALFRANYSEIQIKTFMKEAIDAGNDFYKFVDVCLKYVDLKVQDMVI